MLKKKKKPILVKPERKSNISLTTDRNAKSFIRFLIKTRVPFELTCSNYTTKICSEAIDQKFVYSLQTNQCFAAFAKLKKDCKEKETPIIRQDELVYFEHDFNKNFNLHEVWNIDLKSAYATILFLDDYITADTFQYLCRLPKHDRLASVGMLAAKKKIFLFDRRGNITEFEESISALENFFYYCVKRTFEVMQTLKSFLGGSYLFTWVDGIYFTPDSEGMIKCCDYLKEINFQYSYEILSNWSVVVLPGAVRLSFLKGRDLKTFCLPARQSEFARIMASAMMEVNFNHKNNTHGTSNNLIPRSQSPRRS